VEKEVKTETRLSVVRMCEVAGFSRAGHYRFLDPEKPTPADVDLRDAMQKIALEWPSYGSRRMTRALKARGWDVNRKRVQRRMREVHLLCVAKRKFVSDERLGARTEDLSEPGGIDDPHGRGSVVGGGYHVHPPLEKKPVECPASCSTSKFWPLLSNSTIARARNGRPEYKLAHDAYDTERQDHLPCARTQTKPRCRPGTLDSPQQVVREKEET
jgi:hypothetical protein